MGVGGKKKKKKKSGKKMSKLLSAIVYFADSVRTGRARLSTCFVHQFISSARHTVGVLWDG